MKYYFLGLLTTFAFYACSMGSKRPTNIDPSRIFWVPCSAKMVADYKGKLCVPNYCVEKKKKKCIKRELLVKDFKAEHDFFMHGNFAMVPESFIF